MNFLKMPNKTNVFIYFRDFPFYDMVMYKNLEFLQLIFTAIEIIPSEISWPSTLTTIEMRYNDKLKSIEPHAFRFVSVLFNNSHENLVDFIKGFKCI